MTEMYRPKATRTDEPDWEDRLLAGTLAFVLSLFIGMFALGATVLFVGAWHAGFGWFVLTTLAGVAFYKLFKFVYRSMMESTFK